MWLLNRKRGNSMPSHSKIPANEGKRFPAKQSLDDGDCLRKPFDPSASAVKAQPYLIVF